MRLALRAFAFVFVAVCPALAQAPFPGAVSVNGGWVPCDHPLALAAGLTCSPRPGTPTAPPTPPTSETDNPCVPWPSPYAEPARSLACALWSAQQFPGPAPHVPIFRSGATYSTPYGTRMVVLSVVRGLDGTEVVTGQWVKVSAAAAAPAVGDVVAFRASDGSAQLWGEIPDPR